MWSEFAPPRLMTPVKTPAGNLNQPGRRSQVLSVTLQPSGAAAMSYCHRATGTPVYETLNANRSPGAASVTLHVVVHLRHPLRLVPLNVAPAAADVTPFV